MSGLMLLHIVRIITLVASLVSFILHVTQCILFNTEIKNINIPRILVIGQWQYLSWYLSLGFSLLSSLFIYIRAYYFKKCPKYILDRYIGFAVLLFVISSIITFTFPDAFEQSAQDFLREDPPTPFYLITHCSIFDSSAGDFYAVIYQRCVLTESIWISAIVLCVIWVSLILVTTYASYIERKKTGVNLRSMKDVSWGKYIPDPLPATYSPPIVNSKSGLLTPPLVRQPSDRSVYYHKSREQEGPSCYQSQMNNPQDDYKSNDYQGSNSDHNHEIVPYPEQRSLQNDGSYNYSSSTHDNPASFKTTTSNPIELNMRLTKTSARVECYK
ncbi:hypothetical protein BDB01DRAFT_906319 [Pilobolus umbonatus]|nr:hypothetical protein BDB01DRAFT_906319 [Pilobolus umbonatus]